ncbi:MAG: hypothetical protein OXU27_13130 [Candidatus Poribacteria bacterium]|nr:hypothetical protein [Candidatus Poribacteria bacterium]
MVESSYSTKVKGLTYKKMGEVYVVLDMRDQPGKYVGLIMPIPFSKMWKFCPFLKKGLKYQYMPGLFPTKFRTAERAWKWVEKYAYAWNPNRKYTIFNGLMPFRAYAPRFHSLFSEFRFHSLILKVMLGTLFALNINPAETTAITITKIGCAAFLGIFAIIDFVMMVSENRSDGM